MQSPLSKKKQQELDARNSYYVQLMEAQNYPPSVAGRAAFDGWIREDPADPVKKEDT